MFFGVHGLEYAEHALQNKGQVTAPAPKKEIQHLFRVLEIAYSALGDTA